MTAGEAFVNGFSILNDLDNVRRSLGYCPQFDALDPLLTGKLHIDPHTLILVLKRESNDECTL